MTDKELIERLRSGLHELERTVLGGVPHDARSLAAADRLETLAEDNARLLEALEEIAAFTDTGANERLEKTGSYSSFDEPSAVETARAALKGGE